MSTLDSTLFPGVSSSVEVHKGFASEQSKYVFVLLLTVFFQTTYLLCLCAARRTASDILSAVQTTLSEHGTNSVTLVGHSLGAALSLLDSVFLPLHLPSSTTFQSVLYGLPRVGNQAWANFVDTNNKVKLTHINNKEDPVPILPGMFLGFHHPSGEAHIQDSGAWDACPGKYVTRFDFS